MSGRRKSVDGGANGGTGGGKSKMQLALLKLSTANAFARGLNASTSAKRVEAFAATVDVPVAATSLGGSASLPDEELGPLSSFCSADFPGPLSPEQRGPYYGMYAEYEDVMELLHTGVIADGSARRMLSQVSPDQVVHVAHLGLGACCSVDLVAVHCADGRRLLTAAKSCYLPHSDPRMRASLREAELLRRCTDCPFIMQLLAVMEQDLSDPGPNAAAAAGPMTPGLTSPANGSTPGSTPPRTSLQTAGSGLASMLSGDFSMTSFGVGGCSAGAYACSGDGGDGATAAALATMMSSPGYQQWAQWRGGGTGEDLEWQIMQRLMAATNGGPGGCGGSISEASGSCCAGAMGTGTGTGTLGSGLVRRASLGAGIGTSWAEWEAAAGGGCSSGSATGTVDDGSCGDAAAMAAYGYGGGWAYGRAAPHGGCGGGGPPRERGLRRASIEIIDMYRGCMTPTHGATAAAADPPMMYTLLIGWARCGDLRRLVQLLLSRSSAHQNNKQTGAAPVVSGLQPLVCEDAARFYMGCLVLALEHLHTKLHTVHRDLKLANLLLLDTGYAIVGDLGTAVDLTTAPGGRLNTRVGSPGHMAPECRDRDEGGYDTAADMWSLGACLYSLLTGQLPAGVAGPPNRQWTPAVSRHWSHELQELVGRLLAWSPSQRPTATQLMRDPWFRNFNWRALREHKMQPPSNTPWRELLWWPKESRQLL